MDLGPFAAAYYHFKVLATTPIPPIPPTPLILLSHHSRRPPTILIDPATHRHTTVTSLSSYLSYLPYLSYLSVLGCA